MVKNIPCSTIIKWWKIMENNIPLDTQTIQPIPVIQEGVHPHFPTAKKNNIIGLLFSLLILTVGLAGGMFALNSSKDVRSKASNDGPVISLTPIKRVLNAGESLSLGVLINTQSDTISVVKLQLSYDPNIIQITGFTNGTILPVVLSPAVFVNGKVDVTIAVSPTAPFKGSGIVGTLNIKVLSSTDSAISFTDQTAIASLTKKTNSLAGAQGVAFPPAVTDFSYGIPGDVPITGNWKGGRVDMPGIVRGNDWHLKNAQSDGTADLSLTIPTTSAAKKYYLSCDWTGKGVKTPAVVSGGVWYIRTTNTSGAPDLTFSYGLPTDIPVCGNWTGRADGMQTVGIVRDGMWHLRNSNSDGFAEISYSFGNPGDTPLTGHWTGTKQDLPGIHRGNVFYLRNSHTAGIADAVIPFGNPGDIPIIGDWTGSGISLPGIVRGNQWFLKNK